VSQSGMMPLHIAVQERHLDIVQSLCRARADLDEGASDGNSPLIIASQWGHLGGVEFLVGARADVHFTQRHDRAGPLHVAADSGHLDLVKFFVQEAHADIDRPRLDGKTVLTILRERGHAEVADEVMRAKAGGQHGAPEGLASLSSEDVQSLSLTVETVVGGAVQAAWPGLAWGGAMYELEALWGSRRCLQARLHGHDGSCGLAQGPALLDGAAAARERQLA